MQSQTLIQHIEVTAPPHLAASWDLSGVQIASAKAEVRALCVALDPTVDTVRRAVDAGADFLLCHHPLTLRPELPRRLDAYHQILQLSLAHGLWLYSAHTSLDANPHGPVNWLADLLHLNNRQVLEVTHRDSATLLRVHGASTSVREGLAALLGARARTAGETVEATFWAHERAAVRAALRDAEQAELTEEIALTAPTREFGFGCIGDAPEPLSWQKFLDVLTPHLSTPPRLVGQVPREVCRVAYCPGSGVDLAARAFARGAQVFLTGDVKFHQAQAVMDRGLTMDVGHFSLEESMMRVWGARLAQALGAEGVRVMFLDGCDPFA